MDKICSKCEHGYFSIIYHRRFCMLKVPIDQSLPSNFYSTPVPDGHTCEFWEPLKDKENGASISVSE